MEEIPKQFVENIPSTKIKTNSRVTKVEQSRVYIDDGTVYEANKVIFATDLNDALKILSKPASISYHPVTCLYFKAPEVPVKGPYLFLNGTGKGSINNICFPSEISASYGNGKESLVSVSVLDSPNLLNHELKQMVYGDLKEWFGSQVDLWELIKIYHIENALPQQSQFPIPEVEYLSEQNLLFCGDYQHFASINSAVKSGESAASKIISQLK
jgi:protoporphyrinogen oxidase